MRAGSRSPQIARADAHDGARPGHGRQPAGEPAGRPRLGHQVQGAMAQHGIVSGLGKLGFREIRPQQGDRLDAQRRQPRFGHVLAFLGRVDAGHGKATTGECHQVAAVADFRARGAVVAVALVPECRRSLAHGATLAAHDSA
jgi:hypothetical protein